MRFEIKSLPETTGSLIRRFIRNEEGQAATEYILVIGVFVVFIAVAYNELVASIKGLLVMVARALSGPGI